LRDLDLEKFENFQSLLPEKIKRRCRHVISENARTLSAAESLEKGDLEKVGALMLASHESLRDDYEVSSVELDTLVETARETEGVFGARMTGGGFGGCTINLLEKEVFSEFQVRIKQNYTEKHGFAPEICLFQASDGASEKT
jgi:galactokinase